jgi:hypothetical protein
MIKFVGEIMLFSEREGYEISTILHSHEMDDRLKNIIWNFIHDVLFQKSEDDKQQFNIFSTIAEPGLEPQVNEEGLLTSLHVGQHVFQDKYGEGEIVHISGSGEKAKLTLKFGKQMKIFIAGLAKLRGV